MKRTYAFALVVLLVLAILGGLWLEPSRFVQGWLRGEGFYQSRPTSWWRAKLASQEPTDQAEIPRRLQEGGAAAVPVLMALLADPDVQVRWQAAGLLGKIGADAHPATDGLVAMLSDADPHVRTVAAQALGDIRPNSPKVVAALAEKLATDDRALVIRPLSKFGAAAQPAVPALTALVKESPDSGIRWEAARTLGKIGPEAKAAVPTLIQALKSDLDGSVREHAAESLGEIGALDAVPALTAALADPAVKVRRDAVRSLGQIGPPAKTALPSIEKLLNDPEQIVREAAVIARRRLDTDPPVK